MIKCNMITILKKRQKYDKRLGQDAKLSQNLSNQG